MKAIVFGGTGWVGHHIVLAFHRAGHDVTICSRGMKDAFLDEIPPEILKVQADKENEADVARVLAEGFDVAIDSVPTVASIENIVKHGRRVKRYIHCSSTGGYAPLAFLPGDETMPYDDFMGGWKAKGIVDAMVMDLWCKGQFPATVIRPSYITGPGMVPLDNLGGRRADFIQDVLNDVPLDLPNDGQALLHPIHVADLGRSFLLAAQEPQSVGQIYNICLDKAVTLTQYLQITAAAFDRDVTIQYVPLEEMVEKYGDSIHEVGLRFLATHMCFDMRKAREQLQYVPHRTVAEAIEETAIWAAGLLEA